MKNLIKLVFVFALMAANLSWGEAVEYLTIRVGQKKDVLNTIEQAYTVHDGEYDYYTFVSHDSYYTDRDSAQDLLENTGLGSNFYAYMGYTTTPYVKNVNGSNYVLPITKIIVKDYGDYDYVPDSFVEGGLTYYRVVGYEGKTATPITDLCKGKCSGHHIHIYFTRDSIDGKFVRYVRALPEGSKKTLSGYEKINIDLTGTKGKKPIYLYYKREEPYTGHHWFDPTPTGRNPSSISVNYMYFTGTPRALLTNLGTPKGSFQGQYIDHVEYKINDGPWTTSYRATDAGEYSIQAKIVTNSPRYPDYIYSNKYTMTAVIHKAPKLVVYSQLEDGVTKDYYLYSYSIKNQNGATSNFYSGDKITLTWSDKCGGTATRYFNNDLRNGKDLKSGTYYLNVNIAETPNCAAISSDDPTSQFASFTVKKSKITLNANGGTFSDGNGTKIIEGETGDTYTKPANPTRTGYTFTGWNYTLPSTIQRGEKTITAQWSINTYTLTFDANGGKFSDGTSIKTITQKYNTSFTKPANPTRTDYVFTGWDKAVPATIPAQNMTITAKWDYNRFKVNLPKGMTVVSGSAASDGTYLNGSTIKIRVASGYTIWGKLTYNGTVITPSNGIYTLTVAGKDASVVAQTAEVHGGIQIATDGSKAIIDGNSEEDSALPEYSYYEVDAVELTRTFNRDKTTTIVLPFDIDMDYVWGGIFCKFNGVKKKGNNSVVSLMFVSTMVQANMPYVYVPLGETLSIKQPAGEKITLHTANARAIHESDKSWQFRGTYQPRTWQEGDEDIGRCYRFIGNGEDVEGVAGTFRKTGVGAHIGPMQAYLTKVLEQPQAIKRSYALGTQTASIAREDLPDELGVEIVNEEEKTLALGTFNTVTGKFNIDRWFDLNGKLLKGKPTTKGIYFNNGKKVIVK
jgi:hypothetical protein